MKIKSDGCVIIIKDEPYRKKSDSIHNLIISKQIPILLLNKILPKFFVYARGQLNLSLDVFFLEFVCQ